MYGIDLLSLMFVVAAFALFLGRKFGFKSGVKSKDEEITQLITTKNSVEETNQRLRTRLTELEWVTIPVILHGFKGSGQVLIRVNTRTLHLCAVEQGQRAILKESDRFPNMPLPLLGAPKWNGIIGRDNEILLLDQVYRQELP